MPLLRSNKYGKQNADNKLGGNPEAQAQEPARGKEETGRERSYMKKFKYIDGVKAFDLEYVRILNECVKEVWHTEEDKPDFIFNVLDDLDYIEHNRLDDRTDEVDCYLYINILNIKICDIIRFAELLGVDIKTMELNFTKESEHTIHYFSDHVDYTTLYWKDKVIHPKINR